MEEESHQCLPFPQSRPQPVITPGYCSGHGDGGGGGHDGGHGGGSHGGGLVSDYGAPQSGSSDYTAPATGYGATGAGSGYSAPAAGGGVATTGYGGGGVASTGYSAPSGGGYSVSGGGAVSSAGYADTNLTPDTYGQPIGEQSGDSGLVLGTMSGGTMNLLDNSPCGNPAITQDCARNSGTSNLKHRLPPSKYSRRPGDGQLRRGLGGHDLDRGAARGGGRGGGTRGGRGRGGGAGHDAGGRHDLAARGPGGGAQGAEEGDGPQRLDADRQTRQIVSGGSPDNQMVQIGAVWEIVGQK